MMAMPGRMEISLFLSPLLLPSSHSLDMPLPLSPSPPLSIYLSPALCLLSTLAWLCLFQAAPAYAVCAAVHTHMHIY